MDDTRERLVALEVQVANLTKIVEKIDAALTKVIKILDNADGAKWAVLGIAGLAGFLSGKAGALVSALWK